MNAHLLTKALKLSPSDRLQLIEALWETLSEEDIPVTPEERALLDARLADLDANSGDQSPWPEVRARLHFLHSSPGDRIPIGRPSAGLSPTDSIRREHCSRRFLSVPPGG